MRLERRNALLCLIVLQVVTVAECCHAATFTSWGPLPGEAPTVIGGFWQLSEDGAHVVGTIRDLEPPDVGFHWSRETGFQTLDERYGFQGQARTISRDGSTIVGQVAIGNSSQAFRLNLHTERLEHLAYPSAQFQSSPAGYGVSDDGSVVVGVGNLPLPGSPNTAVVWDGNDAAISIDEATVLEKFTLRPTWARAVSASGKIIVGDGDLEDLSGNVVRGVAFRWTKEQGARPLPNLNSITMSPLDISADGRWTVGYGSLGAGDTQRRSVRWDGISDPLPLLPANEDYGTAASEVSADGSVVIGVIYPSDDRSESYPGIWTAETGFVKLQDVLVDQYELGPELNGWQLWRVFDMSDDARFMTGVAENPNGKLAGFLIDLAPELRGDVNLDGRLDVGDIDQLGVYLREGTHHSAADLNEDGRTTLDDHSMLVHDVLGTSYGDADLDGHFNSRDFILVFLAGEYEDHLDGNSGWATGDWNADGDFTSSDMILSFLDGAYEHNSQAVLSNVPEPSGLLLALTGLLWIAATRRSFRSQSELRASPLVS